MKIKDRYIAKTLLTYTLVVMLVWLSMYSFFNFLAELDSIGTANYTILEAFQYIILQMPDVVYDQASAVILLGCILGMGHLATTGQLLIFRASGLSVLKITWLVYFEERGYKQVLSRQFRHFSTIYWIRFKSIGI